MISWGALFQSFYSTQVEFHTTKWTPRRYFPVVSYGYNQQGVCTLRSLKQNWYFDPTIYDNRIQPIALLPLTIQQNMHKRRKTHLSKLPDNGEEGVGVAILNGCCHNNLEYRKICSPRRLLDVW